MLGVDLPKGGGVVPLEHVLPSPAELNPEELPPALTYILFVSFEEGDRRPGEKFPFRFRSSSMLKFKGFLIVNIKFCYCNKTLMHFLYFTNSKEL